MNFRKILLSAVTVLCMSILLCTGTLAVDLDDPRFAGKTWEEVFADFLTQNNVNPDQVTAAYYNTVTGEEHIHNEGVLMYGASVAKLPTNMLYTERISKGEMEWTDPVRGRSYADVLRISIVNSDNDAMDAMVRDLGGGNYIEFRRKILPYIGIKEGEATQTFLSRNQFAPENILACLKLLYGNEERFPQVEAFMHQASPYDFFKGNQPPYEIAHKYGWYTDRGVTYINDCAIVYTDEPFLLVMFTADVKEARPFLADFCSLMCDYTQYQRAARYETTAISQADLSLTTNLTFIGADPSPTPSGYATWQAGFLGAGCVVLVLSLLLLIKLKWWTLVTLAVSAGLIVVGVAPTELAIMAMEDGSAEQVAEAFCAEFTENRGVAFLNQYNQVMNSMESTNVQSTLINHITDTFDIQVLEVQRAANYITAEVQYSKVDLVAINEALQTQWDTSLRNSLTNGSLKDLYDGDGVYQTATADKALTDAMAAVKDNWQDYVSTEKTILHLTLSIDNFRPVWKIIVNDRFLEMVNY